MRREQLEAANMQKSSAARICGFIEKTFSAQGKLVKHSDCRYKQSMNDSDFYYMMMDTVVTNERMLKGINY